MKGKEPYATQEEFNKRVVHYHDVPLVELAPGLKSHIVSAEKMTVSFATAEPGSKVGIHQHEAEQILVVMDGTCDAVVAGRLYRLGQGDVVIIPPNIEHGVYVSDTGCRVIDIFSPSRQDLVAKLEAVKKGLET